MAGNCKVIVTCFIGRKVREKTTMIGDPPGLFQHAQNFPDEESVLSLIKLNYEVECSTDTGVESDTIIVNNDVGWKKGNDFLRSIDGSKIYAGKCKVITRNNFGRSFGGYNKAFEVFKDRYDYWIFTEDDILINKKNYFKRCINAFEEENNTGFVAIQGLSYQQLFVGRPLVHAHGGVGITHVNILNKVYDKYGKLPHCEEHQSQTYHSIIYNGEMKFTNYIHRLGYHLRTINSESPLYTFAYDYMKRKK